MTHLRSDPRALLPLPHLDFEILTCLAAQDLHGYAIAQEIRERTAGVIDPGMSTLYLAIRRLTKASLVEDAGNRRTTESGGPPRRYYRITRRGREVARLEAARLQDQAKTARRVFLRT